jgi:hypothetical protein
MALRSFRINLDNVLSFHDFFIFIQRNESDRVNNQRSEIFQLGDRKSLFDGFYILYIRYGGWDQECFLCFYCLSSRVRERSLTGTLLMIEKSA